METRSCPCLSKAFESQRFTELELAVVAEAVVLFCLLSGAFVACRSERVVALTSSGKSLRNQMGMTAMFSYLNRRAVPAEEMWEVAARLKNGANFVSSELCHGPFAKVAGLGHFSVGFRAAFGATICQLASAAMRGHAAHLSFVLVGHSCAVENVTWLQSGYASRKSAAAMHGSASRMR